MQSKAILRFLKRLFRIGLCVFGIAGVATAQSPKEEAWTSSPLTYYGSNRPNFGYEATHLSGMFVYQKTGEIVIVGNTSEAGLPVTNDAFQRTLQGSQDGFIAIFNEDCTNLLYASYIGGIGDDYCAFLTPMDDGRVIMGGGTSSPLFPSNASFETATNGGDDGWFAYFNISMRSVENVVVFGSDKDDAFYSCDVVNDNTIALGGFTDGSIYVSEHAVQKIINNGMQSNHVDGMLVVFREDSVYYSTYYGGADSDWIDNVLALSDSILVITGSTASDDITVSSGCYQGGYGGGAYDCYYAKVDIYGGRIVDASYIGGRGFEALPKTKIFNGMAYIWSTTDSDDLLTTPDAYQKTQVPDAGYPPPYQSGFIGIYDINNETMKYLTYISGDGEDVVKDLMVLKNGELLLSIRSGSSDVLGRKRASTDVEGPYFIAKLDTEGNSACWVGNTSFNGWAPAGYLCSRGSSLYNAGTMRLRPDASIQSECFRREMIGIDDVLISKIEQNPLSIEASFAVLPTSFNFYPNPVRGLVTIVFTVQEGGWVSIRIYNLFGRVVSTGYEGWSEQGKRTISCDVSQLPSGTYYIEYLQDHIRNIRSFDIIR